MMRLKIGTHSGTFHADESLAVYMVKKLPEYCNAELLRSRDLKALESCDIVMDVGGVYNPEKLRFDHHQRGFMETFSESHKTKLSSAGLIYKHFGRKIVSFALDKAKADENLDTSRRSQIVEKIYLKLYENFIEPIDANDNGVEIYPEDCQPLIKTPTVSIMGVVSKYNLLWTEEYSFEREMEQFHKASNFMGTIFDLFLDNYINAWLPARNIVERSIAASLENTILRQNKILKLERFCTWRSHVEEIEKEDNLQPFLWCVFQDSRTGFWSAVTVPDFESRKAFMNRISFNKSFRGLRDEALSEEANIPDCVFVHSEGFLGINKTYQGIIDSILESTKRDAAE